MINKNKPHKYDLRYLLTVLALALCSAITHAQTLVDLGTLGGTTSQAFGIKSNGSQVVGMAQNASSQNQAFSWTSGGGMVGLGFLSGGTTAEARAINPAGTIVGWSSDGSSDQAVSWTGTTPSLISNTLGGSGARALGISVTGDVVGWANNASVQQAFVYSSGTMTALDLTIINLQHTGLNARALGISPNGRYVVGEYEVSSGGGIEQRGFVYDLTIPANSYELDGAGPGSAAAANNSYVVGTILSGGTTERAFFQKHTDSSDSGILLPLAGSAGSAYAVNASGVTVGTTFDIALGQRATLWSNTTGSADVTDLNDLHGTGNTLLVATGISSTPGSLAIVGSGAFGGNTHAFLFVIPEPGSGAFLLVSFPLVVFLRRRHVSIKKVSI